MLMVDGGSGSGVAVAAMMARITWGQELDFFDGDMINMLCSASAVGCAAAVGIHKGVLCYQFTKL